MRLFQTDVCYELSDDWLRDMHISTSNKIEVFGDVYKQCATLWDDAHIEVRNITVKNNGEKVEKGFFDDEFYEHMKDKIIENINE